MAEILNKLTEIKQHVLGCFTFFNCGYENVRQLLDDVKGNDPLGNREYQHVIFDDRLGNYFWIEKVSDVSLSRNNNGIMGKCEGALHEATQRFSIFAMAKGIGEESLFQCLAGCLANYGCKLTLTGGEYDSIAVLRRSLSTFTKEDLNSITSNLKDWTIVRIDFSLKYDILPTNYSLDGCDCEPCEELIEPCEIEITGLQWTDDSLYIIYTLTGAVQVGLYLQNIVHITDCEVGFGIYDTKILSTFIQTDGEVATLGASNDGCASYCDTATFTTIVDSGVVNRSGGDTILPAPASVPVCGGVIGFVELLADGVIGVTLNATTGAITVPAQVLGVQANYYYYVTCDGLVTATVRLILTNA